MLVAMKLGHEKMTSHVALRSNTKMSLVRHGILKQRPQLVPLSLHILF